MKCIKAPIDKTQEIKKFLVGKFALSKEFKIEKDKKYSYLPLSSEVNIPKDYNYAKIMEKFISNTHTKKNSEAKTKANISGYDVIGSVAIFEIPKSLAKGEKRIAESILKTHKNIHSIYKKQGGHEGTYRVQKLKFVAGIDKSETTHREHNCQIMLDVKKVYFSPRLSNERKRIFEKVKKGEKVLVMFSGSGVYPVVISKNTQAKEILGIEINPSGHKYALKNIGLNKLKNVKFLKGDVRKVIPTIKKEKFDRIIMPLPKTGDNFLDVAFKVAKKGTIIHLYDFCSENEISSKPDKTLEDINKAMKKAGKKYKFVSWAKCGQVASRVFRICVDFKMMN